MEIVYKRPTVQLENEMELTEFELCTMNYVHRNESDAIFLYLGHESMPINLT